MSRHLYRRPLESLLATWGIGLVLIQLVRLRYGDNIGVNAPTWARGGLEVVQDLIVPYSRLLHYPSVRFVCAADLLLDELHQVGLADAGDHAESEYGEQHGCEHTAR